MRTKNLAEAARICGVTSRTMYNWKEKRGFPIDEYGYVETDDVLVWAGRARYKDSKEKAAEVVALTENTNKTCKEIGDLVDLSPDTIRGIRVRHKAAQGLVDHVKEHKADMLVVEQGVNHVIRQKIVDGIRNDELQALPTKQRIEIFTKLGEDNSKLLHDERLLRGESTENVGMMIKIIKDIKRLDAESGSDQPSST